MKQRLKWEEFYEGRFVITHPDGEHIFRLVKLEGIDGWIVIENIEDDCALKYRVIKERYNNTLSYGLWDNQKTIQLNRDFNIDKLGI